MSKLVDFCIYGAGLAGLHLAFELIKKNASVCIIDPNGIAGGASGTPIGLANPATGRYASKSWMANECLSKITSNLEMIQNITRVQFYKATGILRPAMDEKIAKRMQENCNQQWTDTEVSWVTKAEIENIHPEVSCIEGGVWVNNGLTVNIPSYLTSLMKYLSSNGVEILNTDTGLKFSSSIVTSGIWSSTIKDWDFLPIIPVKGQVLTMNSSSPLTFSHSISALGYIGSLSSNTFIIGSTYEHKFDHNLTDENGKDYLIQRASKVVPDLIKDSVVIDQWSSIRASTPDRMPILGAHPSLPNKYTFTGLGSKGLLYSSYCSELFSEYLIEGNELPSEISISRFFK